jgi:hypothetical protein
MKTAKITVYKFEELSEEAQKIAIENQIRINLDSYFDFSWLEWQFEDEAKEKGFENTKFQYSLSYSQGDGLSFSFDYFNSEKLAEIIKQLTGKNSNWFIDTIQNSIYNLYGTGNIGRYCYAMGEQVKLKHNLFSNYSNIQRILEQVLEEIELDYLELCNKFEKMAYEAYEYELSEEKARFDLIEFDEDFLENGKKFYI